MSNYTGEIVEAQFAMVEVLEVEGEDNASQLNSILSVGMAGMIAGIIFLLCLGWYGIRGDGIVPTFTQSQYREAREIVPQTHPHPTRTASERRERARRVLNKLDQIWSK